MKLTATPILAERLTALVSAAIAIGLLGFAVSAQTGRDATTTNPIEQLESETRLQFRLGLGYDQTLLDTREAKLDDVLRAYHASDQTSEDRSLLITWLRESMVRSMPGAVRPLLATPDFGSAPLDDSADAGTTDEAGDLSDLIAEDPEEQVVALQEQITEPLPSNDQPPESASQTPRVDATPDVAPPSGDVLDPQPTETSGDRATLTPLPMPMPSPTPTLADDPAPKLPVESLPPVAESISLPAADSPGERTSASVVVATASSSRTNEVPAPSGRRPSTAAGDEAPIAVNTSRLSVEMASYHSLLEQVRNVGSEQEVSLVDLQDAVGGLERLTTQYDFILLYYDLLSPAQQERLGPPTDWADVLPGMRQALDRVASQTNGDFLRPLESDHREAISELSQQIDKLARQAAQ